MVFDGVIASEVIEHVPNPEGFCTALAALSRQDASSKGLVIISTLNRTPRSYALAVLAAERLLRLLPVGTHDWDKFITPGVFCHLAILPCLLHQRLHQCRGGYSSTNSLCDDAQVYKAFTVGDRQAELLLAAYRIFKPEF